MSDRINEPSYSRPGFYAVAVWAPAIGRITTATVFADDAGHARSRIEIEGLNGHGLADGERIESVSRLVADHIPDDHEPGIAIGGVAIDPVSGATTPADTDPLDRLPDTVTFSHHAEVDYVVAIGAGGELDVSTESGGGVLVAVMVWGEGELMAEYRHGDTVAPADLPLVRRAAKAAEVSVEGFIQGVAG